MSALNEFQFKVLFDQKYIAKKMAAALLNESRYLYLFLSLMIALHQAYFSYVK
jgi:hypothetical protein